MKSVLPCFYPTTTVLVDDDSDTLENLVQILDLKDKPHTTFYEPRKAISHININTYGQKFSKKLSYTNENDMENVLSFRIEDLLDETLNPLRHHQVSVVIVDYEMPGIDGIQVCEAVTNPFVKKIMLTGVADEKIAIEAFNNDLIYQYVRKQDPFFIEKLRALIHKAQEAYFQDILNVPLQILQNSPLPTPLFEPAFKSYFHQLLDHHKIKEYYLVEETGSFVMIDQNHRIHSLITLDDDLIEDYLEPPLNESLTKDQLDAIQHHKLIPCFFDPFNKPGFGSHDLGSFLHQPTIIQGQQETFYSAFGQDFIPVEPESVAFFSKQKNQIKIESETVLELGDHEG